MGLIFEQVRGLVGEWEGEVRNLRPIRPFHWLRPRADTNAPMS